MRASIPTPAVDRLDAATRAYETAFGVIAPPPSFVDADVLAAALERAVERGRPITDDDYGVEWFAYLPPGAVA